jgi:hypothetical protein
MGPAAIGVDPMAAKASNTNNSASIFFTNVLLNGFLANNVAIRLVRKRAKVLENENS